MKKIALIRNGTVENIAVWDGISEWNPGKEYELVDVTETAVGIGYTYDGVSFIAPPPSAEESN